MVDNKPHLATFLAAVSALCKILTRWYPVLVTYMDTPEQVALAALKAACDEFNAQRPIQGD